jgi:phosphopantothenoylcysteine decarboxylase/phosphopantothenate--cysteine ligase
MECIVTAGPTAEPLDEVRRLTNFSTGRLGVRLADYLADHGLTVTLLRSGSATYAAPSRAQRCETFATTAELAAQLARHASPTVAAVFHAAAVSDFQFGRAFDRATDGWLIERSDAKLPTTGGRLLIELLPTPKLIGQLRLWFPRALLVGWKYELDGGREEVLARARAQIAQNRTDACVANGRAYGEGFGLVLADGACRHCANSEVLYAALRELLPARPSSS